MTKHLGGIFPIVVEEALYRLTSYVLCIQFREIFATYFSPYQFEVITKGGHETVINEH
jgi:hypothetical protein